MIGNNQITIDIYEADNSGNPIGTAQISQLLTSVEDLYNVYTGKYINGNIPGFVSIALDPASPITSATNKFCVVVKETVPDGSTGLFRWFTSTLGDHDFYFKVYYEGLPTPVANPVSVVFADGNWRGCTIGNSGELTTDIRLAAVLIVDDSRSMAFSARLGTDDLDERLQQKKNDIQLLINNIFSQSPGSYIDFWTFGTDINNLSNGFTNSQSDLLNYTELLYNKGTVSSLYEAAVRAISGLNYQSVIDALYGEPHEATDADILWAKEFVPLIIIVSDGDNSGAETPEDVAMMANSVWDLEGVPAHCFGWGNSYDQRGLRTIADLTEGVYFTLNQ